MTMTRSGARSALLGSALLALSCPLSPALAQDADVAALRARIEAQARTIEDLAERLRALETRGATAAVAPSGPASGPASATADATPPAATAATPAVASRVDWKGGVPSIESPDGHFRFAPRLRVLADVSSSGGSRFADRNISGTQLRLVRLGADGGIGDLAYRAEIDFAGDEVTIRDAWLGYQGETALGDLRILGGNKLNDRSLDGATSLTSIPFAERNTVANLIAPQGGSYGVGLFASLAGERGHIALNVKGEGEGSNDGTRNDSVVMLARAHVVPVRYDAGFVHLGGWGFHERINRDVALLIDGDVEGSNFNQTLAVLPGIIASPRFIDAVGGEAAMVLGRGWLAGEYGKRRIRTAASGAFRQDAWSLSGGWFLTGETPPLSASEGVWHRPKVLSPVTAGGVGAIAILARYDEEDQSDAPLGGRGTFATLGLNWYLNDWSGFKLNLVRYSLFNRDGDFPGRDRGITAVLRGEIIF